MSRAWWSSLSRLKKEAVKVYDSVLWKCAKYRSILQSNSSVLGRRNPEGTSRVYVVEASPGPSLTCSGAHPWCRCPGLQCLVQMLLWPPQEARVTVAYSFAEPSTSVPWLWSSSLCVVCEYIFGVEWARAGCCALCDMHSCGAFSCATFYS